LLIGPVLVWLTVIFATSSTWIDRDRFVATIVPWIPGRILKEAFVSFLDRGGGLLVVKGYHAAEYALLFTLCNIALITAAKLPAFRAALLSGAFCVLYAISDEWHQTFVPGRGGTWTDVVIDSIGICIAFFIISRKAVRSKLKTKQFALATDTTDSLPLASETE
jgi:hypothetical protein